MLIPAFPPLRFGGLAHGEEAGTVAALPPGSVLFRRARHALYHGVRALVRTRPLRRIWLPAYLVHCVEEAVTAAGLESCWYDIDPALEPRQPSRLPLRAGDAFLVVHYFGLAQPVEALLAHCAAHEVPLLEDCAHAVRDPDSPVLVGSYGAIGVFSPRKQAPVPGGGVLALNEPACRAACGDPGLAAADHRTLGKLALMGTERLAAACRWNILRLKDRLPVLDAYGAPAEGTRGPHSGPDEYGDAGAPSRLVSALLRRIDWTAQRAARKEGYARLVERLDLVRGVHVPVPVPRPGSVPLSVPIWVRDPETVARVLRRCGIEAMRWPGTEQRPFDAACYPGAAAWRDRTVCLPLGIPLSAELVRHVVGAVQRAVAASRHQPGVPVAS
jgi:hypothetical protein